MQSSFQYSVVMSVKIMLQQGAVFSIIAALKTVLCLEFSIKSVK